MVTSGHLELGTKHNHTYAMAGEHEPLAAVREHMITCVYELWVHLWIVLMILCKELASSFAEQNRWLFKHRKSLKYPLLWRI